MDLITIIPIILQIIQLLVLTTIPIILFFRNKNKNSKVEEFKVTFNCFDSILSSYKMYILKPKIDILIKDHDLDPQSQTNSQKLFNEQKEKLVKEAVQEIFQKYVDKNIIETLENYYTREGLLLFILTYFRG